MPEHRSTGGSTVPDHREPVLVHPASFGQRQLWFVEQLEPGAPVHHINVSVRVDNRLDPELLRAAVVAEQDRQESLRTTFAEQDGELMQVVWPDADIPVRYTDLRDLPAEEAAAGLARLTEAAGTEPFDLATGPLLRLHLISEPDTDRLLMNLHHIVGDAQSTANLLNELFAYYRAGSRGEPADLPELPIQYADYTAWQLGAVTGPAMRAQLDWWRERLAGLPTMQLPTDRPAPAVVSSLGGEVRFDLDADLADALRELARGHRATMFMVLLAGWKTLLHRYTGQHDVVVGSPVTAREMPELERLIGLFVNRLVLRTDLSGDPGFGAVVDRVRDTVLAAMAHQDVPFERLVDELAPQRRLGHTPLFRVGFNVIPVADTGEDDGQYGNGYVRHDLNLEIQEQHGVLAARIEYRSDLFDQSTVEQLARHLVVLLRAGVADLDRPVGTLPMLDEDERRTQLAAPASVEGEPVCVYRLVEARATATPDAPAVVGTAGVLTYRELNQRANRLARLLVDRYRVGPEVPVGLCAERSADALVGMLAIGKAGGAYVPLDPELPAERLAYMLDSAGAEVVLTSGEPPELPARVAQLPIAATVDGPDGDLAPRAHPGTTAYVLFTSGSTGRPKGVAVEHRQLWAYTRAVIDRIGLRDGCYAAVQPFTFDSSGTMIYPALVLGGRLLVVSAEEARDPYRFARLVAEHDVDYLKITPSHLAALAAGPGPEAVLPHRALVVGGESSATEWMARLVDAGRCAVYAHYGPTEATVGVTAGRLTGPVLAELTSTPLGDPLAGTRVYLLDRHAQPVPPGVVGELYLGGDTVARGYVGRPGETAARFVPDPFAELPGGPAGTVGVAGARMYRTGDLARRRRDGRIEFLGRIDHQVKVHGHRIELAEIEAVLAEHPAVAEAVVVAAAGRGDESRLIGYVTAAPAGGPAVTGEPAAATSPAGAGADELRRHARSRLPDYMVPATIMVLDALPLTPAGKVDRNALPTPDQPETEAGYVAPSTPAERTLAGVWCEVLRIDRVGVHDNFFDVGGDSILSIRVVAQARRAGLLLTPKQLFQYQTVAQQAAVAEPVSGLAGELAVAVPGPVPLTPAQRAFLNRATGGVDPDRFSQALWLDLARPVDPDRLAAAINLLPGQHDALRMRFESTGDGWQARLTEAAPPIELTRIDAAALVSGGGDRSVALEAIAADAEAELDLAAGRLVRAVLVDGTGTGAGQGRPARLLLLIHHLVVDALSWRVLLEDLDVAYRQLSSGEEVTLPPATTFSGWSRYLAEQADTEAVTGELDYWLDRPVPRPRPGGAPTAPGQLVTEDVELDEEVTDALLRDVPARYGMHVIDVLLAALALAVTGWLGAGAVEIELESHGRTDPAGTADLSRTVGWFTATYPIVLELVGGGGPARDLDPDTVLKTAKEQLRLVPNDGIGYGLLRHLTSSETAGGPGSRLAELRDRPEPWLRFNLLGQLDRMLGGLALFGPEPPRMRGRQVGQRLLDIDAMVSDDRLYARFTYQAGTLPDQVVRGLADGFADRLGVLVRHARAAAAVAYTPSDFPDAGLDQDELDDLVQELGLDAGDEAGAGATEDATVEGM